MSKVALESVVCAGCTCLCDDIRLTIEGDRIIEATNACQLGNDWFRKPTSPPICRLDDRQVDFEVAIGETSKLLQQSKSPLICGLDGLSTQFQITAVKLARLTRSTIDTTFTNRHRAGTLAMQAVGKVTATLGELASHADVVLFWFCDPMVTHPRFLERFCSTDKRLIVIDETNTETAQRSSQFIQLKRLDVYALLSELRLALKGSHEKSLSEPARSIHSELQNARYAVLLYGSLDEELDQCQNLQALYLLTHELNEQRRAVTIGMRNDANAQSAENVLAWNSGFPFGINFARGTAEYNGLEFSTQSVLERGESDLALICSTTSLGELSHAALSKLKQIPTVVIGDPALNLDFKPVIQFAVGFDGGDWCRMDDVALPVSPPTPFDGDKSTTAGRVLQSILDGLT